MSRNKVVSTFLVLAIVAIGVLVRFVVQDGDDENQSSVNVDASTDLEVTVVTTDREDQQQASNPPSAGVESPTDTRTEPSGDAQAAQSTADQLATTSPSNSAGYPDVDHISDGERICEPECPEQYVVKVARAGRFKRLLLSHDVVRFYGQFGGRLPTKVERAVLDAFETSCFVWHAQAAHRTYYFFDAQPGTDAGVKWRIDASNADVAAAGIANAAFRVNEQELAYFSSAGSVTLSEALNLRCAE